MSLAARSPTHWQSGPGWQPLLQTTDFGAWDAVVSSQLGHHRSRLLPNSVPFQASMRASRVEEFTVLLVQGRGQVELLREQCGHGVLWLPLQGLSHELINGDAYLAEPGMGLLFNPGDVMQGITSEEICGVSILLPAHTIGGTAPITSLLRSGAAQRKVISSAWAVVVAAALQPGGACFAAEALVDALQCCGDAGACVGAGEWVSSMRRRDLVGEAAQWMEGRLAERFCVQELSSALHVSVRTLQTSVQAELGCTPMALAKRLRLRRLRQLLQDPELNALSIAALMEASGLLPCGVTAADYRQWCGESPRRTRERAADSVKESKLRFDYIYSRSV